MTAAIATVAILAGAATLWLGVAPGGTDAPEAPALEEPARGGDVAEGERLYLTGGCVSCHGVDGRGTDIAPSLEGSGAAGAHFYLSTGRMPTDDPGAQPMRKAPAFTDDEIRDLTAYVASLGQGPLIPDIDWRAGDLAPGFELWTANCAGCHSSAGAGGALGEAVFAPPVVRATPVQVAEAIRIGPGAMPVFGRDTLDDSDVADIVRYVRYLEEPVDRGGASLGRLGPVPEGFVAWLVGLPLMLLAARWIGTRE